MGKRQYITIRGGGATQTLPMVSPAEYDAAYDSAKVLKQITGQGPAGTKSVYHPQIGSTFMPVLSNDERAAIKKGYQYPKRGPKPK